MNSKLKIKFFGGFYVLLNDQELYGLHSRRLQALFAYLVLHRGLPQFRQSLSYCFWPDTTDKQARTNLRQLVHHLRGALPEFDTFIELDPKFIRFRKEACFSLDVEDFSLAFSAAKSREKENDTYGQITELERASELYCGDLFPGCYDEWIEPLRLQLKNDYILVLQQYTHLLEINRYYQKAIYYAEKLLHCDPFRETTYLDLMRLHVLNNDRSSAVKIYKNCVDILKSELGILPGPELREFYDRLVDNKAYTNSLTDRIKH